MTRPQNYRADTSIRNINDPQAQTTLRPHRQKLSVDVRCENRDDQERKKEMDDKVKIETTKQMQRLVEVAERLRGIIDIGLYSVVPECLIRNACISLETDIRKYILEGK